MPFMSADVCRIMYLRGVGEKISPPCGIFSADRPPIKLFRHTSCNRKALKGKNTNCSLNRKKPAGYKHLFYGGKSWQM